MSPSPSPDPRPVLVLGGGDLHERVLSLLVGAGLPVTTSGDVASGEFATAALVSERPRPDQEIALDAAAWARGTPWTSALVLAHRFRVGPSIVPGRTPCHDCWRRRVRSQDPDRAVHDAIQRFALVDDDEEWFSGTLSVLHDQVAALAAAEIVALASGDHPSSSGGRGRFWEGDAVHGRLQAHVFASVGRCRRCAPAPGDLLGAFVRHRFAGRLTPAGREGPR